MTKTTNWVVGFLLMGILLFVGCSKFSAGDKVVYNIYLPIVSNTLDSTTNSTATITVSVIDKSLPPILYQGLCWSTKPNPTYDSSHPMIDTTKSGAFTFVVKSLTPLTTYYVRGYAINSAGVSYGKQISFRTPAISPYSIGQFYAGGLIFYIDTTGNHGLVCDTIDLGDSIQWHLGSNDTLVAGSAAVGFGLSNTDSIVIHYSSDSTNAAWVCKNYTGGGYTDWFLPSKDELNLVRQNLFARGYGTWSAATYWSSSECIDAQGRYYAWAQYFSNGYQYYFKQYFPLNVRAVRAF